MMYIMSAKDIVRTKADIPTFIKRLRYLKGNNVIVVAMRHSERGVVEPIYIYGSYANYGAIGTIDAYTVDTGRGYGGKGRIKIMGYVCVCDGEICNINGIVDIQEKRPWYVFK